MMKNQKTITRLAIVITVLLNQSILLAQNWGTNSATGTTINNSNNPNNVLGTSALSFAGKKDLRLFSNGVERMRLMGEPGATQGFLGLGTTNPQSLLHLKGGQVAYLQISNDHTAAFGDQGFSLGLDVNGIAEFIQRHDSPISFKLRNIPGNAIIERLTILNNGNVGIGTPNPIC